MVVDGSSEGQDTVSAVLCSGGLDSVVLVAAEAQRGVVQPIYVNGGFAWESVERDCLERLFSGAPFAKGIRPWTSIDCSVSDLYSPTHWALRGTPPTYNTPDEDVYLVGRNLMLLSKAGVFCALHNIGRIAVGPLAGNPFPDATAEFFSAMADALSIGLDHPLEIATPFTSFSKADVIRLGISLKVPWSDTISCMNPAAGLHCGRCSKCRERLQAFDAVGVVDPAVYAFRPDNVATGQ